MAPSIIENSILLAGATVESRSSAVEKSRSEPLSAKPQEVSRQNDSTKTEPNGTQQLHFFQFKASDIVWRNVLAFIYLHIAALYGIYLVFTGQTKISTFLLGYAVGVFSGFGITAGAHRLWAHKSYKATWQLRLLLVLANTVAFQNSVFEWVRDHRVHHKYTDTNADPHNARRGFFFSHMGWLLLRKHPDIKLKGQNIDMSDLEQDNLVMFQKKYYVWLMPVFSFVLPTLIPYFFLGESLSYSWYSGTVFRYVLTLHNTWLVNSAAHFFGMKPYDKGIAPANNRFVAVAALGEGWHNYHHVFPWDYKTAELGDYSMNVTTAFIDFFAKLGWAYDLKTVSEDIIRKRAERTGDGSNAYSKCIKSNTEANSAKKHSHHHHHDPNETLIWGWDDQDMDTDVKNNALIINKFKSS